MARVNRVNVSLFSLISPPTHPTQKAVRVLGLGPKAFRPPSHRLEALEALGHRKRVILLFCSKYALVQGKSRSTGMERERERERKREEREREGEREREVSEYIY